MDNMAKKMLIDATHDEETRVVVVDGNKVEEFDFESENKRQIAGNIYLAKVTRVEPSLQAAFVDYGGNRHGFLAFSEIHPDYYQIPVADREALMEEERAYAQSQNDEEDEEPAKKTRSRRGRGSGRSSGKPQAAPVAEIVSDVSGMETIDFDDDAAEVEITTDASPLLDVAEVAVATENAAEVATESEQTTVASDAVVDPAVVASDDASPDADVEPAGVADSDDTDDTPPTTMAAEVDSDDPEISSDIIADDASDDDDANDDDQDSDTDDSAAHDDGIESVADDDDALDLRPKRAPRPRRYKIQEVIKVRQIMLVQVVKEERGNKGAALTTYLSLAGRYCVLMPNNNRGGGVSRKITNIADRKRLKTVVGGLDIQAGMAVIVRTAGAKRTKTEIARDFTYLSKLWDDIRARTLESQAPCLIHEEGDLIKRSIRDLYTSEVDEVLVEGEEAYKIARNQMKMLIPSHLKKVQKYEGTHPIFQHFNVENQMDTIHSPQVTLKSGGYLVINQTEALVAIDVNSGKSTRERNIEETALKTNLEAAEELGRQLRLRDLSGLIVVDFIDMEENRNQHAVERRMKDAMRNDRARIQIGSISHFGLLEMSRQRLRLSINESISNLCPHCEGTGRVRSIDTAALQLLRSIEEEAQKGKMDELHITAHRDVVLFILNHKRSAIAEIEARFGIMVILLSDDSLIAPEYKVDRVGWQGKAQTKQQSRQPQQPRHANNNVKPDTSDPDKDEAAETEANAAPHPENDETGSEDGGAKRRRRGRRGGRRRRRRNGEDGQTGDNQTGENQTGDNQTGDNQAASAPNGEDQAAASTATDVVAANDDAA